MTTDRLAINSISTTQLDVEEMLDAYAAAGFRNVEFALGFIKKWMSQRNRSAADLRDLLQQRRLRCIGGFEAHVEVFADEARRRSNHELHLHNTRLLDDLGGGVLVVGTDGPPQKSVAALQIIGRTLRELVGRITESVSLAVEFNWSPIVRSLRSAELVVQAADHPRVGILFDPAHYHCTSSKMEDLTEAVVNKIIHVHVDDMRDIPGDLSDCNADRVLPGEGILPLREILGRIERFGYGGFFSLEMFNAELWKLPVTEAAQRCYRSMADLT